MSREFPLQSLLELSQLRLDEATRRLGELISGMQEAQQRLELLTQYRAEYQARFVSAAQGGLSPREWENYRAFLQKLDDAVAQAGTMAEQSRERTAAGQREWLAKHGKVKAFDTLNDRHQAREAVREERHDRKAADEQVARRYQGHEGDKGDRGE